MVFKKANTNDLSSFLKENNLEKKVNLFCIAQSLHWIEIEKTLEILNTEMKEDSYTAVFAYTTSLISNGENWEKK